MVKRQSFVGEHCGGGLDTTSGPENLSPTQFTTSYNFRFTSNGSAATRLGHSLVTSLGTALPIDNLFTHEPYDVLFCKSGTGIYQSLDAATWYSIGITRTSGEIEDFLSVEKDVHVTNQTDSYSRIAVSTIAAVNSGAGTLSIRAGDGGKFASATFYVRGIAITSGTLSTDSYTGCSGLTASMAVGDIVTQVTTPSNAPKASCLGILEGSTLAGGVLANKSVLYYSAHATPDSPEYSYDYSANGANFKFMPTDIQDIGSVTGGALIVLKKGLHYASTFEVTSEELLTTEIHGTFGGVNNRCVAQGQKATYLLDAKNKRIVPIIADQSNGAQVIDDPMNQRKNLDYPVQGFMSGIDTNQSMSYAFFDPVRAEVHFVVLKNGLAYDVILQESIGVWTIDKGKNIACRANFLGKVYAGSDNNDEIYLDNDGTTDNGIPINYQLVSKIFTVDDKRVSMEFLNFYCGGILSTLGQFTLRMYANDMEAFNQDIDADTLVANGLMSRSSGVPIGQGQIGAVQIGTGGTSPSGFRFTYPPDILFSGESFQFELEITDESTQMELRDFRIDFETDNESIFTHL